MASTSAIMARTPLITITPRNEIGNALETVIASNRPTMLELMLLHVPDAPFRRDALRKPERML